MKNKITLIAALILISCAFAFGTDMAVNNGYDPGAMRKDASNASSPVFPGAVTVTGQTTLGNASATAMSITNVATAANLLSMGNFSFRYEPTTSYLKLGSDLDYRFIAIGPGAHIGANGGFLLITYNGFHNFWGDAGLFYGHWNGQGQFIIATTTAAINPAVKLKVVGGMEIASGGFAVIGSETRRAGYDLTVASGAWIGGETKFEKRFYNGRVNFTDGDTTPSVADGNVFVCAYTNPATITAFDGWADGQTITVVVVAPAGGAITVSRSLAYLSGSADFVVAAGTRATITLVNINGSGYHVSSVNPQG